MEVPEQVFMDGLTAAQRDRNYIFALVQFDKFLAKYPEHEYTPTVLIEKAKCHWALREYEEALSTLDRVIATYAHTNKEIEAIFLKADIYLSQDDSQKAVSLLSNLRESLNAVPSVYQDASFRIGSVYVFTNQWDKAVEIYSEMIESATIDPQFKPTLYIYKGRSLAESGSLEKANEVFVSLQELYPQSQEAAWANVELARMWMESDPASAEEHLNKALLAMREAQERELAEYLKEEATAALQTEGFMGASPTLSATDMSQIHLAFQISDAYAFVGMYDRALEELENIKNRYLHDARIFQAIMARMESIRRSQPVPEEVISDGAAEEEVSAATAPIRPVSP